MPYPLMSALLSDRPERERFLATVARLEAAYKAGSIRNVAYTGTRAILNAALDRALRELRHRWALPADVQKLADMLPASNHLRLVPSIVKRAEAFHTGHPFRAEVVAFCAEVMPLAEMLAALKTKVVKSRSAVLVKAREGGTLTTPKVTWRGRRRAPGKGKVIRVEWMTDYATDTRPTDRNAEMRLAAEAASRALNMHRNRHSDAACFTVTLPDGATFNVDLTNVDSC